MPGALAQVRSTARGKRQMCSSVRPLSSASSQVSATAERLKGSQVLVCGGGGVALYAVKILSSLGAKVTAMQRSDTRRDEIEQAGARLVVGDALDEELVQGAFLASRPSFVLTSVGGSPSDPRADGEGNINLIREARREFRPKFLMVSSIGAGSTAQAAPEQVYQALEPVLKEKERAEAELAESGMPFVVLRPGGLKWEAATGRGVLTEDERVIGGIHREDVAELAAGCLGSDAATNKFLSAVDEALVYESVPQFQRFSL